MGSKLTLDENYIINEYKKGKSSLIISKYLGISKPIILNILNKHNVVRKRDRCSSLNIIKTNDKHIAIRICPKCKDKVKVSSNNSSTTCRNYYKIVEKGSLCRKCSLELQKGIYNPFYGKKHTKETLKKISEKISNNPPKQGSVSNKEKKLLTELKKMKQNPKGSFSVGRYVCDIYIEKYNLIIEFNGDYWHCNPLKYNGDYFHPHKKKTAKDIWNEDKIRVDKIKEYGYTLEVIWESDFYDLTYLKKIINKYERKN
jgi:G:T-mismatch repair DNA endonuclease (very short patch repair protein)